MELGMEGTFSCHAEYHFVVLFVKERKILSHYTGFAVKCSLFLVGLGEIFTLNPKYTDIQANLFTS